MQRPAELRQPHAFALIRHQHDSDRLADVQLAFRPRHTAFGADPRRKADAPSKDFSWIHHAGSCGSGALALNFGSGKQKMKYGSQRKIRSNRLTMMISRMSAQIV